MREPLISSGTTQPFNRMSTNNAWSNPLATICIKITSAICSFLFIGFIFNFSLCAHIYNSYILRENIGKIRDLESSPQSIAYPQDIKIKVTSDLSYYAGLIGLRLIEYEIITEDGFIITLQRLYDPNIDEKKRNNSFKPILLLHGLMQSSGSFLTSGYKSIAYFLVKNNYDIWLGNNRCGFNPKHVKYNSNNHKMWDWDLDEMAYYDIPAMIKQIKLIKLNYNGKISIISHSQGTTQTIYLLSNSRKPNNIIENIDIIDKCVLLAPAIYGGPLLNEKLFIKFMRFLPNGVYEMFFGINSFMPVLMHMRNLTYKSPMFGLSSYMVFSYLFDWNDYLWDANLRRYHFIFSPVFVSVKLMKWWLRGQGFAMNKPIISNPDYWFNENTPELLLVIGGKDDLVNGDLFINRLMHKEINMKDKWHYVKIPEYSHLDVLWADDIIETIGNSLLEFLK
ncbi:hypothetical protein C6P42_002405 [Pichia californica]|nr:hypothetical protein C6P42_002405 [[Candida] californica]